MSAPQIRDLTTMVEFEEAGALIQQVWGSTPDRSPLNVQQLPAMAHAGCQISGAYVDGRMVGATMAFIGLDNGAPILHSHVTGVLPGAQGQGLGIALKWYQREWCLVRGIDIVTWTFDPLILANARFNLHHLGAVGVEYLRNFYGIMGDELNRSDPTDRLVARWDLRHPDVLARATGKVAAVGLDELLGVGAQWALVDAGGEPELGGAQGDRRLVALPADAVRVRSEDPARAGRWRLALRGALEAALDDGHVVGAVSGEGQLVTHLPEGGRS